MEKTRVVDYPAEGIELGQGWDSETGNKKSAIGVVFVDPQKDLGQKKFMSFEKVSDRHSLMQALEISSEFQYRGLNYKAEAKGKFAQNVETSSIFESFVARARVDNAVKFTAPAPDEYADRIASLIDKKKPLEKVKTSLNLDMQEYKEKFNVKPAALGARSIAPKGTRSVRLTPAALKKAEAPEKEFHRVYGDCFVSAITLGAELCAVMTFKEFNKKKREDIETSIEGSGWGFHAEGEFTKKVSEYSKNNKLEVKYYEAGGKGDSIPTDVQGFLDKIEKLPELAANNPVPFKITLQRYDSLPNWPQGPKLTSPTPYEALLRRYFEYETLRNDIQTIRNDQADYLLGCGVDEQLFKDMQDELMVGCRDILKVLETVGQKGATCEMPESAQKSDYEFRIRMPIPWYYDENISVDMDEDDLRELISEYWIENKSERCCKRRLDDPGCLDNKQIEDYKGKIPLRPFSMNLNYCRLLNRNSSKYLAVAGADTSDGANVLIWGDIGQRDIRWRLEQQGEEGKHRYKIRNCNSNKYLAVAGAAVTHGANVIQRPDEGQRDILWDFERVGPFCYKIRNVNSGMYLAVAGAAVTHGANVIQWQDQNQPDIVWCLK